MTDELVVGPVQFAEQQLRLKLSVKARVVLRRLLTDPSFRVGLARRQWDPNDMRAIEVAAVLWRLMSFPDDDVLVAFAREGQQLEWCADMAVIVGGAQATVQSEVAFYQGRVITRFRGKGSAKFWISKGKAAVHPTEILGGAPFLLLCGLDEIPTEHVEQLLARFKPPAFIMATTHHG